MKTIIALKIMSLGLFLIYFGGQAQEYDFQDIPSRPLQIAYFKTTNLVFPFAIKSIDRGSKEILVQKATGIENVLQLKAAKKNFEETNLTVVTVDGTLHSFIVNYSDSPEILNFLLSAENQKSKAVRLSSEQFNIEKVQHNAKMIAEAHEKTIHKNDKKSGVTMLLNGLLIQDNVIYCRIELENDTHIDYDIDQFRFYILDQKKARRTASQEIEMIPIYVEGITDKILGKSKQTMVFALPKFTIPDKKYVAIQLMEKDGGRHLSLKIYNKAIMKAKPVNVLSTIKLSDDFKL